MSPPQLWMPSKGLFQACWVYFHLIGFKSLSRHYGNLSPNCWFLLWWLGMFIFYMICSIVVNVSILWLVAKRVKPLLGAINLYACCDSFNACWTYLCLLTTLCSQFTPLFGKKRVVIILTFVGEKSQILSLCRACQKWLTICMFGTTWTQKPKANEVLYPPCIYFTFTYHFFLMLHNHFHIWILRIFVFNSDTKIIGLNVWCTMRHAE